jgi:hypothetical protein
MLIPLVLLDLIKAFLSLVYSVNAAHRLYTMYPSSFESSMIKIELKAVLRFFKECSLAGYLPPSIVPFSELKLLVARQQMGNSRHHW